MKYQVIVGNIGTVLDTDNVAAAEVEYGQWKKKSRNNEGRAAGESVTLMRDGEPWHEYFGDTHEQDWIDFCAEQKHMVPQIYHDTYFQVETRHGTWIVPSDVIGRTVGTAAEAFQNYVEGAIEDTDEVLECKTGFLARLSAPGYMDCTDWSAHPTQRDAEAYLMEMYG